jgi:hypothetical protein
MRIDEAVRQFRESAIAKAEFATPTKRDHELHRNMAEAWSVLKNAGDVGYAAFRSLLKDDSPHVRLWVASQLLSEGVTEAARVVEAEVASGGTHRLAAEMVLKEWQAGRLRSPFGKL